MGRCGERFSVNSQDIEQLANVFVKYGMLKGEELVHRKYGNLSLAAYTKKKIQEMERSFEAYSMTGWEYSDEK